MFLGAERGGELRDKIRSQTECGQWTLKKHAIPFWVRVDVIEIFQLGIGQPNGYGVPGSEVCE